MFNSEIAACYCDRMRWKLNIGAAGKNRNWQLLVCLTGDWNSCCFHSASFFCCLSGSPTHSWSSDQNIKDWQLSSAVYFATTCACTLNIICSRSVFAYFSTCARWPFDSGEGKLLLWSGIHATFIHPWMWFIIYAVMRMFRCKKVFCEIWPLNP